MPPTDKTAMKQRGRPFQKGKSGNPEGRREGSRNKATIAAQALLDGEAEALTRKAVELALTGDSQALRLCLERLLPVRRERPVSLELPKVEGAADLPNITASILEAVSSGDLTPGEGATLAGIVTAHGKTLELADLETRLSALEAVLEKNK